MTFSFKSLKAAFVLLALLLTYTESHRLSANPNYYGEERAAWGGNGGWWGGGNLDLYDDYPWRTDDSYSAPCQRCRHYHYPCSHCGYHHPNTGRYCYHDSYTPPQNEYEYNDTVPGAGLYLNLEPK